MNLQEIEKRLLAILEEAGPLLPKNELDEMLELVRAGEPGIGLENFCTQLLEYEVELPHVMLAEVANLGRAMGIQARYWERLKERPVVP